MFSFKLSIVICITALFTVFTHARVVTAPPPHDSPEGRHASFAKRAGEICPPRCAPSGSCGVETCPTQKRSLADIFAGNDTFDEDFNGEELRLGKRLLRDQRSRQIPQYFSDQTSKSSLQTICPAAPIGGWTNGSPSYCIQQEFASATLTDGQWLSGTGDTELTGCTVLVVVSARAVYICHFWQDLHYTQFQAGRQNFGFQPVLNMISGTGVTSGCVGPALTPSLFTANGDNARAWIMTPRLSTAINDPNSRHFPNQFNSLSTLLAGLIPGITIGAYNYDYVSPYDQVWRGAVLFEYDTNADGRNTDDSADWRLWLEAAQQRGSNVGQSVARNTGDS